MSQHIATIEWSRGEREFNYESYGRDHTWTFEGGSVVLASAAAGYRGDPTLVDPEEAFVASLSSCHMLTLLALAAKKRFVVDHYRDAAVGTMEKNADGRFAVTRVVLRPRIVFGGATFPSGDQLEELHHRAHEMCFIANSVTTEVTVEQAVAEPQAGS